MGKVGSSSIRLSLSSININNPVYYIHYLSWSSIVSIEKYYLDKLIEVPSHIKSSKLLRQFIDTYLGQIRFKIITLVRDPIARNISSTFQNIHLSLPHIEHTESKKAVNNIISLLMNTFKVFDEKQHQVCTWFDNEIGEVFHFDVFSVPFDINRGYQIYTTKYCDILIMRLENLNVCCQQAMDEFLGLKDFILTNNNSGKNKWYADIYNQTLTKLKIPKSYLDQIYNSRFAKHFYSYLELQNFKMKWLNKCLEPDPILKNAEYEFNKGNLNESIQLILSVIDNQPRNTFALNLLGKIHWQAGDNQQAIKYFQMVH
jgi:tetratricopeptide (TPR) repeat protein